MRTESAYQYRGNLSEIEEMRKSRKITGLRRVKIHNMCGRNCATRVGTRLVSCTDDDHTTTSEPSPSSQTRKLKLSWARYICCNVRTRRTGTNDRRCLARGVRTRLGATTAADNCHRHRYRRHRHRHRPPSSSSSSSNYNVMKRIEMEIGEAFIVNIYRRTKFPVIPWQVVYR